MKTIKTTLLILLCAVLPIISYAQDSKSVLRPRMEIAEVEESEGNHICTELEVFYMADESPRTYYLSAGNLGIGNDIVQIKFDPVYELFIPLGSNLDEAIAKLQEIKDFYKEPRLAKMEISGCLAPLYPNDNYEPVTLTRRNLIMTKLAEFSVPRDGMVRATYISRANIGSLLSGVKFYKKLHPKE
jgi:hypothetical protein